MAFRIWQLFGQGHEVVIANSSAFYIEQTTMKAIFGVIGCTIFLGGVVPGLYAIMGDAAITGQMWDVPQWAVAPALLS